MPHITISRTFEFDAAHRVLGHAGKCKFLHGHHYVAEVTITAPGLDELGMIADFGDLKNTIGKWIDNNWDHNTILNKADPLLGLAILSPAMWVAVTYGRNPYLVMEGNPTAELMARELWLHTHKLIAPPANLIKVRIHETPKCYADFFA